MPRAKSKKSAKGDQTNKAELIRNIAKSLGSTSRPRDIVAAMKEKGFTVGYSQIRKALRAGGFKRKGRGKKASPATSSANGHPNKAQRIRDVAQTLGKKVRPKDVIAELAKEGISVSFAQVSATLRAAGYRRRRRGKKVAAAAHSTNGNGLNLDALIAAKALATKLGGIDVAQEALAALKKLG